MCAVFRAASTGECRRIEKVVRFSEAEMRTLSNGCFGHGDRRGPATSAFHILRGRCALTE